jgi:dephospho-CoA kinase
LKIIGLTGGIGSGKTIVADLLRVMGFPVYDSDSRSKELCNSDSELKKGLKLLLGESIYKDDVLDRSLMADKIFNNQSKLDAVNSLIHPVVMSDFAEWTNSQDNSNLVFMESAILFETGLNKMFDNVLIVTAPEELRIERVCKRNGLNPEIVFDRIKNQMNEEKRISLSDLIIVNDGEKSVILQLKNILEKLM